MSERVRVGRKYPVMKWKSWGPKLCPHCTIADCLRARRDGTCPIEDILGQLEKSMKEEG